MTLRWAVLLSAVLICGCDREEREFRAQPAGGEARPASVSENRAYDVSMGKQWFRAFNCNGCHANGGGDAGPPLIDDKWIYGASANAIAETIREGRPRGMPSFKNKATEQQIRQLAAYVRSLGALVSSDIAPGRSDDMRPHEPESRLPATSPSGDAKPAL